MKTKTKQNKMVKLSLIRAIAQKDLLYIISNGFGFAMQTTLLSIIVFG